MLVVLSTSEIHCLISQKTLIYAYDISLLQLTHKTGDYILLSEGPSTVQG